MNERAEVKVVRVCAYCGRVIEPEAEDTVTLSAGREDGRMNWFAAHSACFAGPLRDDARSAFEGR